MRHQLFIASYRKDFEWLIHCLASIKRFARGFEPPAVCVSSDDYAEAVELCERFHSGAKVVVKDGQGFMRAQIAMMEVDLLCPEADVVYLVGSDCIFLREFDTEMYCRNGKPGVLMNSYAALADSHSQCLPWRRGVERVLGFAPSYEYMRRLPSVFPASIFAPMRAHVEKIHGKPFDEYIVDGNKARRDTSEANILGAYAHWFMPETCEFVPIDQVTWNDANPVGWPSALGQLWSHGGLDLPADACFEYVDLDGVKQCATGRTPRQIFADLGL